MSLDGCGRINDNIWIEKFCKTIKYEYIRIQLEKNGTDLFIGIKRFIDDYIFHRRYKVTDAANERRINLLLLPSVQEEKATGLNQPYSTSKFYLRSAA